MVDHDTFPIGPLALGVFRGPLRSLDQLTSVWLRIGLLLAFSDSTTDPNTTVGERRALEGVGVDGAEMAAASNAELSHILDMLKMLQCVKDLKILKFNVEPLYLVSFCGNESVLDSAYPSWLDQRPKKGQGSDRKKTLRCSSFCG